MRAGQPRRWDWVIGRTAAAAAMALAIVACGPTLGSTGSAPSVSAEPGSPTIEAKALAFDRATLEVPSGRAFTLVFDNEDGAPHNVAIYRADGAKDRLFAGEIFGGPATRVYSVPVLAAGTYTFQCDIHQDMHGTVIAGPSG